MYTMTALQLQVEVRPAELMTSVKAARCADVSLVSVHTELMNLLVNLTYQ